MNEVIFSRRLLTANLDSPEARNSIVHKLNLYGLYRNALYDTRVRAPIDRDIKSHRQIFPDSNAVVSQRENGLYHYACKIALLAVSEAARQPSTKVEIVTASDKKNRAHLYGFIIFYEVNEQSRKAIYIDHVCSNGEKKGLGTELMKWVMSRYDAGTEFILCVRKSNNTAVHIYRDKLGFNMDETLVAQYDYNPEYFHGMRGNNLSLRP